MLAGPQERHGKDYNTFTMLQTMIDLSYTQLITSEKLLPTEPLELISLKYVSIIMKKGKRGFKEVFLTLCLESLKYFNSIFLDVIHP